MNRERITPRESKKPKETRSSFITLNRQQAAGLLKIFAQDFLSSDSPSQTTVLDCSNKITNPQVCSEITELTIDPKNFLYSLGRRYQPKTNLHHSVLGSGKKGINTAKKLEELSQEFGTIVLSKDFSQDPKKLPLELRFLLSRIRENEELKKSVEELINNDGILFFVKRRKIPPEISDLLYQLSLYTGRRLDWVNDWFESKENGNSFDTKRFFGRLTDNEKKEVEKLLDKLDALSHHFFQLYPVDKDGNIDKELEEKLNSLSEDIEISYRNLLITQADLEDELKTTKLAFLLSIPGFFVIDQLLEANPVLARSIPPALADILTLWAEASPFINRNLPHGERVKEFARLIKDKYKASLAISLLFLLTGSQLVERLENAKQLIAAGFTYAFIPFVGALITTYQSFLQEYQRGKELREKAVKGYEGLTNSQLTIESLLKTIRHPARLYLLLAGFLGIGEGVVLGAFELLNNPLALIIVGELNESALTTIGLFLHQQSRWEIYHHRLKRLIPDRSLSKSYL